MRQMAGDWQPPPVGDKYQATRLPPCKRKSNESDGDDDDGDGEEEEEDNDDEDEEDDDEEDEDEDESEEEPALSTVRSEHVWSEGRRQPQDSEAVAALVGLQPHVYPGQLDAIVKHSRAAGVAVVPGGGAEGGEAVGEARGADDDGNDDDNDDDDDNDGVRGSSVGLVGPVGPVPAAHLEAALQALHRHRHHVINAAAELHGKRGLGGRGVLGKELEAACARERAEHVRTTRHRTSRGDGRGGELGGAGGKKKQKVGGDSDESGGASVTGASERGGGDSSSSSSASSSSSSAEKGPEKEKAPDLPDAQGWTREDVLRGEAAFWRCGRDIAAASEVSQNSPNKKVLFFPFLFFLLLFSSLCGSNKKLLTDPLSLSVSIACFLVPSLVPGGGSVGRSVGRSFLRVLSCSSGP